MKQCQVEVQVLTWVQKMHILVKHILRTKIVTDYKNVDRYQAQILQGLLFHYGTQKLS